MKNLKTNDELIKELLTPAEQAELYADVEKEVLSKRGGSREGAGRKKKDPDNVLSFQMRVSQKERNLLKHVRSHHIDCDALIKLDYDALLEG